MFEMRLDNWCEIMLAIGALLQACFNNSRYVIEHRPIAEVLLARVAFILEFQ